jgi:hypothetical protein
MNDLPQFKAIETRYAGCRFRSRLEARWAVFFDHLKIKWQYEPQGYSLPSGPYLPDFWLPDAEAWIEIKGSTLTKNEQVKLFELAHNVCAHGHRVRLLAGDIPREICTRKVQAFNLDDPADKSTGTVFGIPSGVIIPGWIPAFPPEIRWDKISDYQCVPPEDWIIQPGMWIPGGSWDAIDDLNAALTAARSARFEHGQSSA